MNANVAPCVVDVDINKWLLRDLSYQLYKIYNSVVYSLLCCPQVAKKSVDAGKNLGIKNFKNVLSGKMTKMNCMLTQHKIK